MSPAKASRSTAGSRGTGAKCLSLFCHSQNAMRSIVSKISCQKGLTPLFKYNFLNFSWAPSRSTYYGDAYEARFQFPSSTGSRVLGEKEILLVPGAPWLLPSTPGRPLGAEHSLAKQRSMSDGHATHR